MLMVVNEYINNVTNYVNKSVTHDLKFLPTTDMYVNFELSKSIWFSQINAPILAATYIRY